MMDQGGRKPAAAGEAFWRFALALYARPGVAEALIALQDRAGRDVALILYGLWLGATRGEHFDTAALRQAAASVAPLNAVVAPLRGLRRRLKGAADPDVAALRQRIASLEIAAERQVMRRLAASPRPPAAIARDAAAANLALCLGETAGSAEAELLHRALAALMRR
jgi:uncharacterized protein (TIGR02444 family)